MTIGIIGASLAGLAAAREFAKRGHQVMVFEKDVSYGGRLLEKQIPGTDINVDIGTSHFTAHSDEFKAFCEELKDKGIIETWTEIINGYDGEAVTERVPGKDDEPHYVAKNGLSSIGNYLSRWTDIQFDEAVTGITFIGRNVKKKMPWMINLTSFNVFELDAVIVALPGTQAYGVIQTAQDETAVRKIISEIDQVNYEPQFVLSATYQRGKADFKAIDLYDHPLTQIVNESDKRDYNGKTVLVARTSAKGYRELLQKRPEERTAIVQKWLGDVVGRWAEDADDTDLTVWKYSVTKSPLEKDYIDWIEHDGYFGLVGDYFHESTLEASYLSGVRLARDWISKF